MLSRVLNLWDLLIRRPIVGEQTTANLVYQPYQGLAWTGINGAAGVTVTRGMGATSPATVVPGPTHVVRDPTVTGNPASTIELQALTGANNRQI